MYDLVITRHQGLVDYLLEEELISSSTPILGHASKEDVNDKDVIGVLPHSLSVHTSTFSEIPLILPPEMRGKELTADDVRRYKGDLVTYKITIA